MTTATTGPELERELLARLGLTSRANSLEIQTAHDDLVEYLERAPADLRAWARREIEAADEAYALLSDPNVDFAAIAASRAPAPVPAAPVGATATPVAATVGAATAAPVAGDDYIEELDPDAGRTRKARRAAAAAGSTGAGSPTGAGTGRNGLLTRLAIIGVAVVGIAAVVVIGFNVGGGGSGVPGINGTPAPESSAAAAQVDQAQVAALMKKISENPNDVATLQQLGDLYFQTGDYETAGGWMEKILGVEPRNVTARLALGAALFNSGKATDAEKQWRQVLEIDAKNVEAHYDLGFMYLSQDPPDMAKVKAEWNEVIAIAPDSAIAKTVATHLKSLDASPAPSGAAGSPGASGAPSSAAPSTAAPSAAASPAAATPTPAGSPAP